MVSALGKDEKMITKFSFYAMIMHRNFREAFLDQETFEYPDARAYSRKTSTFSFCNYNANYDIKKRISKPSLPGENHLYSHARMKSKLMNERDPSVLVYFKTLIHSFFYF